LRDPWHQQAASQKPDLVVSGINRGANLGDDITYSGTVSAAIEGTIFGIPSIAFSLISDKHYHYETAAFFATKIASYVLEHSLPYDTLLNVNLPNIRKEEIKGIKLTRQGKRIYENSIQETFNPWERSIIGSAAAGRSGSTVDEADMEAVQEDYISITPIHLDLTNHSALTFLRNAGRSLICWRVRMTPYDVIIIGSDLRAYSQRSSFLNQGKNNGPDH